MSRIYLARTYFPRKNTYHGWAYVVRIETHDGPKKQAFPYVHTIKLVLLITVSPPRNSWRFTIRKVTALPMEDLRTTYQHDPDDLIGQLVVNLLPQKDDALAVESVVDVDPVRSGRPGNSVRHLK